MKILIDRSQPLVSGGSHYYRTDTLRIDTESLESLALTEIELKELLLLDLQEPELEDPILEEVILLDAKVGEALANLSAEEQGLFWQHIEPQIKNWSQKYLDPDKAREGFGFYLDGTAYSYHKDATDECRALVSKNDAGETTLTFVSIVGFAPAYPSLVMKK